MSGSLCLSVPIPMSVSFTLPTYWFAFLSIYLSRSLCFYLYLHLSLYLSERKKYATLPSKVKVDRSKALHSCETFSKNGSSQPQNETKSKSTTSNMKEFCKTSFKTERSASCHCVVWDKATPGHTECCTCQAKSSLQTWRLGTPKCNPSQEMCSPTGFQCVWLRRLWRLTRNASFRSLQTSHTCLCFCCLFARCGIHCACHARPHPNFKKSPETVSL